MENNIIKNLLLSFVLFISIAGTATLVYAGCFGGLCGPENDPWFNSYVNQRGDCRCNDDSDCLISGRCNSFGYCDNC